MSKKTPPLFRVQDITRDIRCFLETQFPRIGIRGEISSLTRHTSGHWYFNLKDSASQIQGVMFKNSAARISFLPKAGDEVIVWGKITVYEPRGNYQILADDMELSGDGLLQKSFEQLKEKLKTEGLFERKQPLPYLPQHIAIITSLTGAALRDVLNVLHRRHKGIKITISPALMEGAQAASSVISALGRALRLKDLDLVLITRGGGSAESLWAFNDEKLAREVFKCPLPVVSAIGHEIDFTILDFTADLRAPTPSAAAELISKNAVEILETLQYKRKTLTHAFSRHIQNLTKELGYYKKSLISPISKIEDLLLRCDDYTERLKQNLGRIIEQKKAVVEKWASVLNQMGPRQVMNRGYALCFKKGQVLRQEEQIAVGDLISIQFFKGRVLARITKKILEKEQMDFVLKR